MKNVGQGISAIALITASLSAEAQVSVGPDGVRSGETRIDSTGVQTKGADVTSAGVTTHRGAAGATIIKTNGGRRAIDCGGRSVQIDGNANHFTVANCSAVTLNGNVNVLSIRFNRPGHVAVMGNRNEVTYSAAPHIRASASNMGSKNVVVRR